MTIEKKTDKRKLFLLFMTIFMCAGILMTSYVRFQQETKKRNQLIRSEGSHFVKMISLAYGGIAGGGDESSFRRELSLAAANRNIAYLIIHDKNREDLPVISFPSSEAGLEIPDTVRDASLYHPGFQMQAFVSADRNAYVEFSHPIYREGLPVAVVRLGMNQEKNRFLAWENLLFPLQIVFFIGLGVLCVYYWFALMLKPFQNFAPRPPAPRSGPDAGPGHVGAMIQRLEASMTGLYRKTEAADDENRALSARMKIVEYQNERCFQIANSLDFGVFLVDMKDTLFFANDYLLKLLGKNREEVTDQPVFDALDHDDLAAFIRRLGFTEGGGRDREMEITFPRTHPDRRFLASAGLLTDPEGTLVGRFIRLMDITREKTTEKAQQDFINHIAHELRTPLTNIKAYNEMIMDGEIDDQEMQKEFFNTINDETNRLSELIKNILKLAETEMGQMTVKTEIVKTQWLVESSLDAVDAVAQEKRIHLTTHLPDNLPKLSGDKEMLKAALINVLGNAVKYTPEQGKVVLAIRETEGSVAFEVEDTGYGIDPKDLPHVFEKFYRSENDRVSAETGTGLGLAITAEIVKTHGGSIEVSSEPAKGSKFTITIPKGKQQIG